MIFAGSQWYTLRTIESNIGYWLAKNQLPKFKVANYLVSCFLEPSRYQPNFRRVSEIDDCFLSIQNLIKTYEKQQEETPLSKCQARFYQRLLAMKRLFSECQINNAANMSFEALTQNTPTMLAQLECKLTRERNPEVTKIDSRKGSRSGQ